MFYSGSASAAFAHNSGFYFRDEETPQQQKSQRATKSTDSSADLLSVPKNNEAELNPYTFAMASIYNHSHPNSRAHTPAPSRPASVHREADDKELNPYAYAMGNIYKHSHSRSRSTTPAQSRAASVHREEAAPKEGAFAKMWRRSPQNSRESSVAPAAN